MTNAIEQTKREMYAAMGVVKSFWGKSTCLEQFESAMEAHLEELRKDAAASQARISELYSEVQHWKDIAATRLTNLSTMTEERDTIQLRLHAIDYAYSEQQRKTGTCVQVCGDRGSREQPAAPDANVMAILGAVIDCQQLVSDWAVYGYGAKKQMKKMAYVLNNNPELRAALDHFEGRS